MKGLWFEAGDFVVSLSQVYFRGLEDCLLQGLEGKEPEQFRMAPGSVTKIQAVHCHSQSRILAALLIPQAQMQEAALGMNIELLGSGPRNQPFPLNGAAPPPKSTLLPLSGGLVWLREVSGVGWE